MELTDKIEEVLIDSRRGLFAEKIASEIGLRYGVKISSEEINDIVVREPKRFVYHTNGSVVLHYEKLFWDIIDKLRNYNTHSGFYQGTAEPIVLFVLRILTKPYLLVRLGLDPNKYETLPFSEKAQSILYDINDYSELLSGQLYDFIKQSSRMEWREFEGIEYAIRTIPDKYFGLFYSELFRVTSQHRSEFTEPNSVCSELLASLASTISASKVFDPFAGIGSFITELHKVGASRDEQLFWLNDINLNTSVYGKINLLLNGIENFNYSTEDAFTHLSNVNADLILTNPPFLFDRSRSVTTVVDLVLSHLSNNGQALIIVPDSYLFSPIYKSERIRLIENGHLRSIISLPSSLFRPHAPLKTSIIHLGKDFNPTKSILFIKTDELTVSQLRENINKLTQSFYKRVGYDENTKIVSKHDIDSYNFNLSVPLYFTPALRSYGNFELGQVIQGMPNKINFRFKNREQINDQKIGFPIIRASNLADSLESIYLDIRNIKHYTSQVQGIQFTKNTLLLSLVGPSLRPTLVDSESPIIIDSRSVIPLRITDNVLPEYLIYQLQESDVATQVKAYYQGVSFQYIRRDDLFRIRIYVPDKKKQIKYIEEKRRKLGINLLKNQEEITYERFSTLKHSMAQPLRTLSSDFKTLSAYLNEQSEAGKPINLMDYTAPTFEGEDPADLDKIRLANVTDRINNSIKYLQNSLVKVDALIKTNSPLDPKPIKLKPLLEKVLEMNKDNTYSYRVLGSNVVVKADQFLIEVAFSCLIENAVKHGFDYKQDKDINSIVAEINELKYDYIEVTLKNNGCRMADGMNNEYIFEKGRTSNQQSGSGLGGFVINEIIKKHQGTIELISIPNDTYPVQFKIILPR